MNPQPSEHVGQVFALIFVLMVLYYAVKAYYNNPPIHMNDLYTIGYLEHGNHSTIINIAKDTKPNFEMQQIYLDCVDALHALGMKKTEAKNKAKYIFSSMETPPATVQEFLIIALRNNI